MQRMVRTHSLRSVSIIMRAFTYNYVTYTIDKCAHICVKRNAGIIYKTKASIILSIIRKILMYDT